MYKELYPQWSQSKVIYYSAKSRKPLVKKVLLKSGLYLKLLAQTIVVGQISSLLCKRSFPPDDQTENDIMQQNSSLFVTSLDTDSFFTNILLDEHINICTAILCKTDNIFPILNEK